MPKQDGGATQRRMRRWHERERESEMGGNAEDARGGGAAEDAKEDAKARWVGAEGAQSGR